MAEVKVYADADSLARGAAEYFIELAAAAIAASGGFSVALSGGSTPRATFALLASDSLAQRVDWSKVFVFWGDERCVPPDHSDSNYRVARETLLSRVPVSEGNVYRLHGEADPAHAAAHYEQTLRAHFGARPRFDLVLLGMGDDGHTASLFPGTKALDEQARWVAPNYVDKLGVWRVTLTAPAINASAHAAFLVSGAAKAERLRQVMKGEFQPQLFPAQLIKPDQGDLVWLLDAAAAAAL